MIVVMALKAIFAYAWLHPDSRGVSENRAIPAAPFYHAPPMSELSPYMQQAHEQLDSELEKAARLRSSDPDAAWGAFMEFVSGLQRHMSLEEEVLFPAFLANPLAGAPGALTALRGEHQRILALLDELEVCQAEFNPRAARLETELRALLDSHHAAEERIFAPWLATTLNDAQRKALLERMARFGVYVAAAAR
jgi:hemerythrin-like domain-containing protein